MVTIYLCGNAASSGLTAISRTVDE